MNDVWTDYRSVLLEERPLLDLRAPTEFAKGSFPGAVNLPLIDDRQRELVGRCYKEQGPAAAMALGHQLVSDTDRADKVDAWHQFARQHPDGAVFCFRGGQRSQIVQQWLAAEGVTYPRVAGGYKALRQFLIQTIERCAAQRSIVLLGGRTGVGKTDLLITQANHLDLEGFAQHRGSAFGRRPSGQPNQINFENAIGIRLLALEDRNAKSLLIEDESRAIGACHVPDPLWRIFDSAALLVLEDSMENRVARIRRDYVVGLFEEYQRLNVANPFKAFSNSLLDGLRRISKRLGGLRYRRLETLMREALGDNQQLDSSAHDGWIRVLLEQYYDPMYDYQLQSRGAQIRQQGSAAQLSAWLTDQTAADLSLQ